jgi:glycosyltransferase involved in cell wall biosynthesis
MKVLLVSPYHGGSHASWADGYQKFSQHDVTTLTLPDRFWKWRMHGGAVTLARRFMTDEAGPPDVVLATDMLDLSTFAALTRRKLSQTPLVLYMHENQLTYPLPVSGEVGPMRRQLGERDQHYAFVNYASMMTADLVLFNSHYHKESFFAALPNFLKHFPEYNELGTVETLREKSEVLPVGVDFGRLEIGEWRMEIEVQSPLIVWNQRWEYDKNPMAFFAALFELAEEGVPFRLALCGQQYGKRPSSFDTALSRLSGHIVHVGYADLELYRSLLWEAAVTISTAHHEFFGISILEAVGCQTFPILPNRLSYPELIPEPFHLKCLYENHGGLLQRLRWALAHEAEARKMARGLATAVQQFGWSTVTNQYDTRLEDLVTQTKI